MAFQHNTNLIAIFYFSCQTLRSIDVLLVNLHLDIGVEPCLIKDGISHCGDEGDEFVDAVADRIAVDLKPFRALCKAAQIL